MCFCMYVCIFPKINTPGVQMIRIHMHWCIYFGGLNSDATALIRIAYN